MDEDVFNIQLRKFLKKVGVGAKVLKTKALKTSPSQNCNDDLKF